MSPKELMYSKSEQPMAANESLRVGIQQIGGISGMRVDYDGG
jgi:hypothetical protein